MRTDYYVYALLRADGVTPFYIGKGRRHRAGQHAAPSSLARRSMKNAIAKKVISEIGHLPVEIIASGLTEQQAFSEECCQIEKHGRRCDGTGILANMTYGGEGASGHVQTAADRAKKSAVMSTPEARARASKNSLERFSRAEERAKLSAGQRRARSDPQVRAKLDAIRIACLYTPEVQDRRLAALRLSIARPEVRARLSASLAVYCKTPEGRASRQAAANARWAKHRAQKLLETA